VVLCSENRAQRCTECQYFAAVPVDGMHREMARRIQQAAKRKGWSVNQVADFSGLGRGSLSEIMRARRSPTLRTLRKIADALDVDVRDLVPASK
jgi:DNA-binding phage protein